MAKNQSKVNPADFDLFEPEGMAEYVKRVVAEQVAQALEPHKGAMRDAEHTRDYNALAARHGQDEGFQETMAEAVQAVIDSDGALSLPEAFKNASGGRGGKRSASRPKSVKTLGPIMEYNRQTGRGR